MGSGNMILPLSFLTQYILKDVEMVTTLNRARKRRQHNAGFWLYLLPAIVFFVAFKYWPFIYSTILSFAKWNFVSDISWVGFKNYASMFNKTMFIRGVTNTLKYIVFQLPGFVIFPLLFSVLLLNVRSKKLQSIYKSLFFIPTILALSICCYVWLWMYSTTYGLFNNILGKFGISNVSWLTDKKVAFWSIILVCGWKYLGQNLILFMAGMLNISQDCIEAAGIDGANGWQTFWRIKMPLLWPTTVYVLITSVIFAADRSFTAINILTAGGPNYTTTNLAYVIYEFAFKNYNIGIASSIAVFTSLFFLIITVIMMKTLGGFGYNEE